MRKMVTLHPTWQTVLRLSDWRLCIKFVNDTSTLKIIPRNSTSLLDIVASDIHSFAMTYNIRLNPSKCKEMYINFLHNANRLIVPIIIVGNVIQCVNTYKILRVIMDEDLKWNRNTGRNAVLFRQ